jgi:hypothetical protein
MTNTQKDWEVLTATVSPRNGELYIKLCNNCLNGEVQYWHINHYGISSDRYDWTGCEFNGDAKRVYMRMIAKASVA